MAENTNTKPSINAVLKESLGSLQSLAGPDAAGDKIDNLATIIDYKMVTFSLAGKDYAIDIMKVKEIAKAGRFTYVPNALPFVLGVYNLRGEIIPIVDLRLFFNIEVPERQYDAIENMLIVSVGEQIFGVVVDDIDKVVGIQKSTINPPHPLFGDINIKYIQGVVEVNNRLYILLDIERI
ncbi:MAG: chemotaxis protein CheW, partial [Treponema sp.]|nr:chemotaxis protein CheW [Treponema sp.]